MNVTDPEWLKANALHLDRDQKARVSFAWRNEAGQVLFKEVPVGKHGRVYLTWALVTPMTGLKSDLSEGTYQVVTFSFGNFSEIQYIHQEWPFEHHDVVLHCTDSHYQHRWTTPCKESLVEKVRAKGSDINPDYAHLALRPFVLSVEEGRLTKDFEDPWEEAQKLKSTLTPIHEILTKQWWPLYKQISEEGSQPSADLIPPEPIASLDALMHAMSGDREYPGLTQCYPNLHDTFRWEGEWFFMEEGWVWTTATLDRLLGWAKGLPDADAPPLPLSDEEATTIDHVIESLLDGE